jgi:small-conductance mechanosensitive channel
MRGTLWFLVAAVALGSPLGAQTDTATQVSPAGSPVVVGHDTLFYVHGNLGPFTPADRAAALARRIEELARDPLAKGADVRVVDTAGVTDIRLGTIVVMTVTERDATEMGVARIDAARQYAVRIQEAVRAGEAGASIKSIALGALWTLLATLVLLVIFRVFNWFFPLAYRTLERWRGTRIPSLRIQRLELLSANRLTDTLIAAAKVLRVVAVVFVLYVYLPLVLSFFPWTQNLSDRLFRYILDPAGNAWSAFVAYVPSLFAVVVIVVIFRYVLKFIHVFFQGIETGAISLPNFHRDWADPTYKIVRFLVIVFAAIVIYPYLPGSDTAAFKGISVFLGVLISFGSSSAIANVVAGVVMTYMRPFQLGDRVRIADTVGDIVEKTLLVTRVRTVKNVDVTIPNAMVLSSHIINFSSTAQDGGLILHTGVTIGYDVPWKQVHQLLSDAADRTEGLLEDPRPFVLQTSLDDFYVSYELNAYTETPNAMSRIYSDLHRHIQDTFNEAGVEIMSPHYAAQRDGNQTTVPADHLPKGYQAPAFRLLNLGPTPPAGRPG